MDLSGTLKRLTYATFFINVTDVGVGIKSITLKWNDSNIDTENIIDEGGEDSVKISVSLQINGTQGDNISWNFTVIDINGNSITSTPKSFIVNNSDPVIKLISPEDGWYTDEGFNFTFNISDNDTLADIELCRLEKDNHNITELPIEYNEYIRCKFGI